MKPFLFVLLVAFSTPVHATHIIGLGSKTVERCAYALDPAVALVRKLHYPDDWTVYVTCTDFQWQVVRQKSDATTSYAFTRLGQRISVMRGEMFRDLPYVVQWRYTPETVFAHELGHIHCYLNDSKNRKCTSEAMAEKWMRWAGH